MAKSPAELIAHYLEFGTPVEFDRIAEGVIQTLSQAGYKLVPIEPSEAMLDAAGRVIFEQNNEDWATAPTSAKVLVTQMADCHYRAMVEAAK